MLIGPKSLEIIENQELVNIFAEIIDYFCFF